MAWDDLSRQEKTEIGWDLIAGAVCLVLVAAVIIILRLLGIDIPSSP